MKGTLIVVVAVALLCVVGCGWVSADPDTGPKAADAAVQNIKTEVDYLESALQTSEGRVRELERELQNQKTVHSVLIEKIQRLESDPARNAEPGDDIPSSKKAEPSGAQTRNDGQDGDDSKMEVGL